MTWYRLKSFIAFLYNSTNQYGVHPPFLYKFLTKCLYAKMPKTKLLAIKTARRNLMQSEEKIKMKDIGAGSQTFSTVVRPVHKIAKNAGMPLHQSKLMSKIIDYFHIKNALELGTSVGLGSIAMACQNTNLKLDTVEACPDTSTFAKQNFNNLGLNNISLYNTDFNTFINELPDNKTYDMIYLDGHHNKQATLEYIKKLKKHIHKDSIIILDDIYWSRGMQEAWHSISQNNEVKLSLDLYFWGIIFFKPELSKQHFKLRCFV